MNSYKLLLKKAYSIDGELKNFTNESFLISIGYPKDFIKNFNPKFKIFPVSYPFEDIDINNKIILDIGCGVGFDAYCAIKLNAKFVVGIDISQELLKYSFKGKNFFKICSDIDQGFPLKAREQFDIAIFNGSFNQIIKKFLILKNLKTLLKKDGKIIICDLLWYGSEYEKKLYETNYDAWVVNIGGSLTETAIWNIEKKVGVKLIKFEIKEDIFPLKRFRVIFKK